jgi:hypothetical protein
MYIAFFNYLIMVPDYLAKWLDMPSPTLLMPWLAPTPSAQSVAPAAREACVWRHYQKALGASVFSIACALACSMNRCLVAAP